MAINQWLSAVTLALLAAMSGCDRALETTAAPAPGGDELLTIMNPLERSELHDQWVEQARDPGIESVHLAQLTNSNDPIAIGDMLKIPLNPDVMAIVEVQSISEFRGLRHFTGSLSLETSGKITEYENGKAEFFLLREGGISGNVLLDRSSALPDYRIEHLENGLHRITQLDRNHPRVGEFEGRWRALNSIGGTKGGDR